MDLIRLTTAEDKRFRWAMEVYGQSFPAHEQRECASQRAIMGDEAYHFVLIAEDGNLLGALLYWETEMFFYVEHLCIHPRMRGRQCGQRALARLADKGKTIILEIDPPTDDISLRRLGFYRRAGYQSNPFPHVHPPYRVGDEGHGLMVMSYPEALTQEGYHVFHDYLSSRVMGK